MHCEVPKSWAHVTFVGCLAAIFSCLYAVMKR